MQETIFRMRLKKWNDAIAVLEANSDSLHSDEQEAIGALRNLWRTVSFSPSCTQRVERLVRVLSEADKLHGNNRDIIQASKDFRGVAKEMYTTDAETLQQFRSAMQLAMGGPQRTDRQRQRMSQTSQASSQQSQSFSQASSQQSQSFSHYSSQRPGRSSQRPGRSFQQRPSQTRPSQSPRHPLPPEPSPFRRWLSTAGRALGRHAPGLGVGAALLVLIALGGFMLFRAYTAVQAADARQTFVGNWNGELRGHAATLIVDTVAGDTVTGRLFVKDRTLRQTAVTGHVERAREGSYLFLSAADSAGARPDSLRTRCRLFVPSAGYRLAGLALTGTTTAAVNLHKEGADSAGASRRHATLTASGPAQYIVSPTLRDSVVCTRVVRDRTTAHGWKPMAGARGISLARGELIDSVPQAPDRRYLVFESHGRYYRLYRDQLIWSRTNSPSTAHAPTPHELRHHSAVASFFATLGPCWAIIGLLAVTLIISVTGLRFRVRAVREAGLVVVPLCLLAVAGLEIFWYQLMGSGAFWWCDYDRYGFFGTLLRVVPFLVVVAVQLLSVKLYELLLNYDRAAEGELHVKPAVVAILVAFPTLIAYVLVTQLAFHWQGKTAEEVGALLFLLIILVGIVRTFVLNIRDFGAVRGSLLSVFVLIYAVSCIVAVAALIAVIVRIVLIVLAALFILGALAGAGGGGGLYRDRYGNLYRRV